MAFIKSILRTTFPSLQASSFIASLNLANSRLAASNRFPTISENIGHISSKSFSCTTCSSSFASKYSIKSDGSAVGQTSNSISKGVFARSAWKRSYSTNSLFRLNETNAGLVQPVLDIENILKNQEQVQESVSKRKIQRNSVSTINDLYLKTSEAKKKRDIIQQQRDQITLQVQAIVASSEEKTIKAEQLKTLKAEGRRLREELREHESQFNRLNDELVDYLISLPNLLDPKTPDTEALLLNETQVPENVRKWEFPVYTAVESPVGPGYLAEFPIGQSAWLDIHLRERAQTHLLKAGFIETGNAEYVKRIILQGAGMDPRQFLRIREPNIKKGWEHATYLAGGASFPSFLVLFAQSIIDSSQCLPLRYFVIGRSYKTRKERPGSYQSHNVQAFIACKNEEEMEQEFEKMRHVMESFYSTQVGFAFQTQVMPAPRLELYEKKRLSFVANETEQTPSKIIGSLSAVGDHVSKRLLCCYFDENKQPQFLHLISAQFFDITHFLRTTQPKRVDHKGLPVVSSEPLNKIVAHEKKAGEVSCSESNTPVRALTHGAQDQTRS